MKRSQFIAGILLLVPLTSCTSVYYAAMHKIGKDKRDILVNRIAEAKTDEESTGRQLKTTLEAFQQLTGEEDSKLQHAYDRLNTEFEKAQGRANALDAKIDSIQQVGSDLFVEWRKEIAQIQDPALKSRSRVLLQTAQVKQADYLRGMRKTTARIKPVLQSFQDQVLFLKHNLNARAVGSLKQTSSQMNSQVADLIMSIEGSKTEADQLISTLTASPS